jgi:hypothetical protein
VKLTRTVSAAAIAVGIGISALTGGAGIVNAVLTPAHDGFAAWSKAIEIWGPKVQAFIDAAAEQK